MPGGNVLFSGANMTDDQSSILELTVLLITEGHIHFTYRVDAEARYDGLSFYVNGILRLPLALPSADFQNFEMTLPAGYYTFKWVYSKDFSISQGDDGAYIKVKKINKKNMIEISH